MGCYIGKVYIVNNGGTIIFGNGNTVAGGGTSDENESSADEASDDGVATVPPEGSESPEIASARSGFRAETGLGNKRGSIAKSTTRKSTR